MKKRMLFLVLILLMIPILSAGAETRKVNDESALLSALAEYRSAGQTDFEITLSKAYFNDMKADQFGRVWVLKLAAGIDSGSVRYREDGTLSFGSVAWIEPRAAFCSSERDVQQAFQRFISESLEDFQLICTEELFFSLLENQHCYAYASLCGIEQVSVSYADPCFFIGGIIPCSVPYAVIGSDQEYLDAVSRMAAAQKTAFYLVLEPGFGEKLGVDKDRIRVLQAQSLIDSYSRLDNHSYARFEYDSVSYSDAPRIVCSSAWDVVQSIRRMGAVQAREFHLIFSQALYKEISAGDFDKLHQLEAEAGLITARMQYDSANWILYYSEAEIQADSVRLATPAEAVAWLNERVAAGDTSIALFCTEGLYVYLLGGKGRDTGKLDCLAPIHDLASQAGIEQNEYSYYDSRHLIILNVKSFYPGALIIQALENGSTSALSGRERQTLQAAMYMAAYCADPDPLTMARKIHDRLCESVVYVTDPNTDEDDTAIGALLNGEANCDGYADAFYLVGTVCGLHVRYQYGDVYAQEPSAGGEDDATHMWNLLEIDGAWRLVDVTWDDTLDDPRYTWFNLGRDRASRTHIWNEEMTVPLDPVTDLSTRPDNEFLIRSEAEAETVIRKAVGSGYRYFELVFDNADISYDAVFQTLRNAVWGSFEYGWDSRMMVLWVKR